MSLAARCSACGTVFRVVQDQLRVSEGWVRCGRCNDVFNAAEVLFDIDTGAARSLDAPPAPPPFQPPPKPPSQAPLTPTASSAGEPEDNAWGATVLDTLYAPMQHHRHDPTPDRTAPHWAQSTIQAPPDFEDLPRAHPAPAPGNDPPTMPGLSVASLVTPVPGMREPPDDAHLLRAPSLATESEPLRREPVLAAADLLRPPPAAKAPAGPLEPTFLRAADRDALWRKPAVRVGLVAGVVLLSALVVAQLGLVWRDTLAAHVPATAPTLNALCQVAGCTVQPLRRLDALAVDSSGLNRLDGSTLYRLQVVLHNRADTPVMMPTLDLSLTDAQGQLVARRMLQAADLGLATSVLQAGQELPIKVLMSTGERRVDGYTLELFYP